MTAFGNSDSDEARNRAGDVVVIAIVSYGRADDVARCLAAVSRLAHGAFEVVVVENAGAAAFDGLAPALIAAGAVRDVDASASAVADGVADGAQARQRVRRWQVMRLAPGGQRVVLAEATANLGYGGGVNAALDAIAGRPGWRGVWVLNPDTEPEPGSLGAVLAHVERGGYGLTGCRLVFRDSRVVQNRGGTWRRWIARGLGLGIGEPIEAAVDVAALEARLDWVSGAAMYATRAYVEAVGPMDDSYFLYCEDIDWSLRRGGFPLGYAHEAIVLHEHGTTIGSSVVHGARSPFSTYLTERNRLLLTRRRFATIYPIVAAVCLLGLGQSYLLRGNWQGFKSGFRGWLAGLLGETGAPPAGAF